MALGAGSAFVAVTTQAAAFAEDAGIAFLAQPAVFTQLGAVLTLAALRALLEVFTFKTGEMASRADTVLVAVAAALAVQAEFIVRQTFITFVAVRA